MRIIEAPEIPLKTCLLITGGIVGASLLGGAATMYMLVASAPMDITRQNSMPGSFLAENEDEKAESVRTITIR